MDVVDVVGSVLGAVVKGGSRRLNWEGQVGGLGDVSPPVGSKGVRESETESPKS